MTIEKALHSRVTTHAGLFALVSTRAYPNIAERSAAHPYIVYHRISSERNSTLLSDTNLTRSRFQLDCWSGTYDGVRALADQVRSAFQRWGDATIDGTLIEDTEILDEQEDYDGDTKTHRVIIELMFTYRE